MSAALRMRETVALQRLGNALGVRLDPDKVDAVLLEELAGAAEKIPPDLLNPERRLYQGEPFPVYGRHFEGPDCSVCTTDLAYAQAGAYGFDTTPSTEFFEDCLIDILRADLERLRRLEAIDADDPDGGRNTIPVRMLAGCHVEIVHDPDEAAEIDAAYRAKHDPPRSPLVGE